MYFRSSIKFARELECILRIASKGTDCVIKSYACFHPTSYNKSIYFSQLRRDIDKSYDYGYFFNGHDSEVEFHPDHRTPKNLVSFVIDMM